MGWLGEGCSDVCRECWGDVSMTDLNVGPGGGFGGGRFLRGNMAYIILPEMAVLVLHVSPVPILYELPLAVLGRSTSTQSYR